MKKIALIICLLACTKVVAQQASDAMPISLQQAMDLGIKNRFDVLANKFNVDIADNQIRQAKDEYLPDLSGSGNIRYNPQIQSTLIPAGFLGPQPSSIAFGAKTNTVFGLDLNQAIFKPGLNADVKIAKNGLAVEREKNREQEIKVREQIAQAYLNILLKNLQVEILRSEEQRYKAYAALAEGQFKLGTIIANDYARAMLDYENAKVATSSAIQTYQLAIDNIKYQINIPVQTKLILSDSLNSSAISSSSDLEKGAANDRAEIKLLVLNEDNNQLQLKRSMQNTLPSVSFYANYSGQFQYNNFSYFNARWWSPFSYFGVSLTVPISGYYKNSSAVKERRIQLMQTALQLKQKMSDVDYEIQKANVDLANAVENMKSTKKNYELSQTIYNTQQQQYGLGTLLYSNLLEADRSFNTTEQNYIKAVYDFLIAKVNYRHAIGSY